MNSDQQDAMTAYLEQAWSLQGQLPLLIGIAALLGLGKGGVPGFATVATAATVATSPTNIPGGLGLAVALQVPILTMIDISASWLHYQDLDVATIRLLLPMSFVGMAFGQFLDRQLTDAQARLLVGILLLLILAVQLGKESLMALFREKENTTGEKLDASGPHDNHALTSTHHEEEDELIHAESGTGLRRRAHEVTPEKQRKLGTTTTTNNHNSIATTRQQPQKTNKYIWACVVGIVGGAATMLTNAMGPILNVYLLSVVGLSPTAYIGTRAMFFCFLNCGKLPMRFWSGTLALKMLPLAGCLGMVSVLGVMGAKPIMLSMSESKFVKLELAVVAFSGLRLCWMGFYGL